MKLSLRHIFFIVLLGLVVGAGFLGQRAALAGTGDNVSGWAWSETIGWISFNCTNTGTCGTVDYGVNIDQQGNFAGYAWSDNIGWVQFNPAGPYPSQPNSSAKLNTGNNEVSGWARALANGGGWDGWIKLRKHASDGGAVPDYGVAYNPSAKAFFGWAWGSDVVGWLSFDQVSFGGLNQSPSTPPGSLQVTTANSADYCGSTAFPPVRVNWQFNDPDQGDTQSAFQIQVFQGGNLVIDTGKKTGSSQSYVFQLTGEQLLWNTAYSWQVKVWDNKDTASSFTSGQNFTTPAHHFPVPNFSSQPASPGIGEQIQFQDQTVFGPGSFAKAWAWDFESNNSVDSSLQNPTHAYAIPASYQITLQSSDDVGSCTTVKSLTIGVSLPEWQEISPF